MENENNDLDKPTKIDFDSIISEDADAIEAFLKNFYSKSVPPPSQPTKKELSFWEIAGLQSSMFSLAAVGGIVLSAIRTGGIFYIIELALVDKFNLGIVGKVLAFISMFAALGAFELFVLAYGIDKGMKSNKLKVSGWGIATAMLTIIFASVFSSFSIVDDVPKDVSLWMDIIMSLVSGFASALVVYFSSENLGFVVSSVTVVRNDKLKKHGDAFAVWRKNGVDQYLESAYNIRKKKSEKIYGSKDTPPSPTPKVKDDKQDDKKEKPASYYKDEIIKYLNNVYSRTGEVLRVVEITDYFHLDYNKSKGFVSSLRKDWAIENNIALKEKKTP